MTAVTNGNANVNFMEKGDTKDVLTEVSLKHVVSDLVIHEAVDNFMNGNKNNLVTLIIEGDSEVTRIALIYAIRKLGTNVGDKKWNNKARLTTSKNKTPVGITQIQNITNKFESVDYQLKTTEEIVGIGKEIFNILYQRIYLNKGQTNRDPDVKLLYINQHLLFSVLLKVAP